MNTTLNRDPKNFVLAFILFLFFLAWGCSRVEAQTNPEELPQGYPNYANVQTLLQQIQNSATPRFKPGHTLIPNYSWIDPLYAGGYKQAGINDATACHNSNLIQYELAKDYNYIILLQWGGVHINDSSVSLANRYPQYKRGITTLRAQTKGCSNSSCLWCGCLDGQYYLQDSQGRYLGWGGEIVSYKGTWRPTSPVSVWNQDGINAKNLVNSSLTKLVGNVDYINEDGEVYPLCSNYALQSDPVVNANIGTKNPQIYLAEKVALLDNAYRDQILSLPKMANAKYSEYIFCGHRTFAFFWEGIRKCNTPMNGQYYPTTDFYPRYPSNWQNWISAWHGLKWVTQSRYYEIAMGDKLFSPYTGAGWDANIENNVLSAQFLGLCKLLSVYGAEYFFPAYFIENLPAPEPKSYAYQYIIPPLAQGVTSRMENLLRNGILMDGDMIDNSNTNEFGGIVPTPFYQFYAGANNKIVAARKLGNEYWITGTIQNSSNTNGSTPYESTATINLDGEQLTFKIRRQGSSYYYNKSTKVWYQLDGWHEYKYPTQWTKDIEIEAENADVTIGTLKTYAAFPNLLNYQTVVSLSNTQTANYSFTIRDGGTKYLFMKLSGTGNMEFTFDGVSNTLVTKTGWNRISLNAVAINSYNLNLKSLGSLEIDSISITSNPNKYPFNSCTPPSVVITANDPAPCIGKSVVLSASSGASYLWSTLETTQSITVINNGNYTVTVSNGQCSSTSQPYTVNFVQCATCEAPTGLYNSTPNKNNFYVYWNKVENATNGYTIYVKDLTTGIDLVPYTKVQVQGATNQRNIGKDVTHPQLKSKHSYSVYIVANCSTGNSVPSITLPPITTK